MSLHELDIARKISDVVVAVGDGKVLRIGTPAEVCTEEFIRKLYNIEGVESELLGDQYWEKSTDEPASYRNSLKNAEEISSDMRAGEKAVAHHFWKMAGSQVHREAGSPHPEGCVQMFRACFAASQTRAC